MQTLKDKKGPSKADTVLVNFHKKCHDMRMRLEELRDHLMQLRDNVGPDRHSEYYSFLEKYDAINKAAEGLIKELKESLTQGHDNFVSVPIALTADPAELPDFLRTKLDPEVERYFDSLHNMYASRQQPGSGAAADTTGANQAGGPVTATTGTSMSTSGAAQHKSKELGQQTESASVSGSAAAATSSSGQTGPAGQNGGSRDVASRRAINAAAAAKIDVFNEMISNIVDELDGKRLNLASTRPSERPGPVVTPAGEAVIAALTSGQGLTVDSAYNSQRMQAARKR